MARPVICAVRVPTKTGGLAVVYTMQPMESGEQNKRPLTLNMFVEVEATMFDKFPADEFTATYNSSSGDQQIEDHVIFDIADAVVNVGKSRFE